MVNTEEGNPSKPEKSSPEKPSLPATDQNSVHVYPDWAMMQAYYGPRLAMPPYLNSAVTSPHAPPPYMWAPLQSVIPPYGAPYAAFYAHGGVYAHPGVPIGGAPVSMDGPAKSPGNTDGGFMKKLKEFDGLAISMGNGNGDSAEHARRLSESEETEGSSDGSNGVMGSVKKRSRHESPNSGDGKALKKSRSFLAAEVGQSSEKMIGKTKSCTELVLKDPSKEDVKPSNTIVPQSSMPGEAWFQNERELKRERRKQSNRESARRSRLRKQAETEELASRVQTLTSENMTLKSEINKLMENSEKLRLENSSLMEKLKDMQPEELNLHKIDDLSLKPVGTVNLLARVNDKDSTDGASHEKTSSGAKLHQLLDANKRRTDAVAAR